MADLVINALVVRPDGTPHDEHTHKWWGLDQQMMDWFGQKMVKMQGHAKEFAGKHEDSANATLSATIDGVAQPDVTVTEVSYKALTKFEREAWHVEGELISIAEEKAKHKK